MESPHALLVGDCGRGDRDGRIARCFFLKDFKASGERLEAMNVGSGNATAVFGRRMAEVRFDIEDQGFIFPEAFENDFLRLVGIDTGKGGAGTGGDTPQSNPKEFSEDFTRLDRAFRMVLLCWDSGRFAWLCPIHGRG